MRAGRFVRWAAGVLGCACGAAVLAAPQVRTQPPPAKATTAPAGGLPAGALARLGDTKLRHAGSPTCVAFSPDGKRVFTGGNDGTLRVWDVTSGDSVNSLHAPFNGVTALKFTHGGTRLAVQFSDAQIRFLDPDTLKQTGTFNTIAGSDFAVSADGALVAASRGVGLLTVSELGSGLAKVELPAGPRFAFHPGGKTIAVADEAGKVTLYLLAGGKPLAAFDHGGPVNGLAFSPDGKRLATGGTIPDAVVKVWDTGAKNPKPVEVVDGASAPRAWLTADRLAAANKTGVGVYDFKKVAWVAEARGVVGEWAVSPDGTKVAATGTGGLRVRMWDLTTGKQLHAENDTFPDAALLAPTPDGRSVFIVAGDGAFRWPVGSPTAVSAGTLPGKALMAAAGGGRLAVATADAVLIYDSFDPTKTLPAKPTRSLTEHAAGCKSVAVSADGKKVAYSGDGIRIVVADAGKGTTLRVLPTQTIGLALAFSPDGEKVVVLGRDGFLRLWTAAAVEPDADSDLWKFRIPRVLRGTVAFSPDGRLVAASASGVLKVLNAADGTEVFTLDRVFDDGLFRQSAFSPDGRLLVTGSDDANGAVQVWEIATRTLVRRYTTGMGAVTRLGMFPDGTRAVSAGAEEAVTLWDLTFRHNKGEPGAEELLAAWGDLDSLDGAKGYPAVRTLSAGGPKAVRIIAAGVEESLDARKKVEAWVKDLGSEEFADREAATKHLLAQGFRALPAVAAAAAKAESPEVRTRAAEVADKLSARGFRVPAHGLAGDALRLVRAVQVLEDIGGAEAKALLTRIAELGGRPADDARAAMKRLGK